MTRDVFNDPRKAFPLISDGYMVLYDVPRDAGVVNGSFSVTFQRCMDFGCGRTVFGDLQGGGAMTLRTKACERSSCSRAAAASTAAPCPTTW